MALIHCKECGNEFSDLAAACPKCGAPTIYSLPAQQPAAVPPSLQKAHGIEEAAHTPAAPAVQAEPVHPYTPAPENNMPRIQQPAQRKVTPLLAIGIFFFPIIFSWFLLKEGYSRMARVIGFAWLAFCMVITIQYIIIGIGIYRDLTASDTPAETTDSKAVLKVTAQQLYDDYNNNELAADERYKGKTLLVSGVIDSVNNSFGDRPYLTLESGSMFRGVRARLDPAETDKAVQLQKGQTVQIKCIGESLSFGSPTLSQCKIIGVAQIKPAEDSQQPVAEITASPESASDAADAAAARAAAADIEQFPMQNSQPEPSRPANPAPDTTAPAPADQPQDSQPAPTPAPEHSSDGNATTADPQGSIF